MSLVGATYPDANSVTGSLRCLAASLSQTWIAFEVLVGVDGDPKPFPAPQASSVLNVPTLGYPHSFENGLGLRYGWRPWPW